MKIVRGRLGNAWIGAASRYGGAALAQRETVIGVVVVAAY